MKTFLWIIVLVIFFLPVSLAAANEVHISAAASLTDAVKELVVTYELAHPEIDLQPNFASSGSLARQIVAGAPADIYISADPRWMDYLQQEKMIVPESKQTLVYNSLVFVGLANSKITDLQDLPELKRIAIGSPGSVPAGKYAEQALIAAGLYRRLAADKKIILAKDVRQALLYADRGEVDGAFVYRTDALPAKQVKILFAVPQELYPRVSYPIALTLNGSESQSAQEVLTFLMEDNARMIFRKYGFVTP